MITTMTGSRIADGQEAEHLLARLRPHLQAIERKAIAGLIMHHRTETLTDGIMRSGIATLAVLETLKQELDQRIRLGHQDAQEARGHE